MVFIMHDTTSKILIIVSIIGGFIGIHYYLNYKIEKRISDPEFLYELSQKVRPALIFDASETIHADMGASDLIEIIEVVENTKDKGDYQIIITPKNHLPYPPLLESIDTFEFVVKSERGKGHEWIYNLSLYGCTDCKAIPRFKLEILKTH